MYQLLTNKLLFIGKDFDSIKEKILAFQPENLDVSGLSDIAADLIKQILVKDPKQRPGINQILYHYFFHDIEFPKYITPEILEKIDKEENKKENKKENIKNLNVKLYTLIVDDIPEIKYEDIKNYVIKESVSAYEHYITYFHQSTHHNFCYYEFNNEIVGIIDKNIPKNKENKNFNMIYNTETNYFYLIKIDEDNENNDIIERYSEEEFPEKHKKIKDLFLYYYKLNLKRKMNIETKEENLSIKEENLSIKEENSFSQSTKENSLSKNNSNIIEDRTSDKSNLLYVRKIIVKQKLALLFLSNQTIEAIFTDKVKILMSEGKGKIQIIDKNNKINVVSTMSAFQNDNHDFTVRLKMIKKTVFNDITSMISENNNNNNQNQKNDNLLLGKIL
jgi:hypothetical protein